MGIVRLDPEEPGYDAAITRARDECWQFITRFREGTGQQRFLIKAKLKVQPGDRVMTWLVLRDIVPHGYVAEMVETEFESVQYPVGTEVHVRAEDLIDWAIIDSEVMIGGFTVRYLFDHATSASRDEILLGFDITTFADIDNAEWSIGQSRLRRLLARPVPLVELQGRVRDGISVQVACRGVNRVSADLVAIPYPFPEPAQAVITVHADPSALLALGAELERVPIDASARETTWLWRTRCLGALSSVVGVVVEELGLSQPGAYDEGQPWGSEAPHDPGTVTLIAHLSSHEHDSLISDVAAFLNQRPQLGDAQRLWAEFRRDGDMFLCSYPERPVRVGMTFNHVHHDGSTTALPYQLTIQHLILGAAPVPVPELGVGHKGIIVFTERELPDVFAKLPALTGLNGNPPRIGLLSVSHAR